MTNRIEEMTAEKRAIGFQEWLIRSPGSAEPQISTINKKLVNLIREAEHAARLAAIEECAEIVQLAREGEIDGDFRSIIHRIRSLTKETT